MRYLFILPSMPGLTACLTGAFLNLLVIELPFFQFVQSDLYSSPTKLRSVKLSLCTGVAEE